MENNKLTEKDIIDILAISIVDLQGSELLTKITEMATELLKYKQLQEQIGCPLEVVFKALTNGIYRFSKNYEPNFRKEEVLYLGKNEGEYYINWLGSWSEKLADYKITWWLREDRSE